MEWDEFTKHLIELGLVSNDTNQVESEKKYSPSDKEDKETHETEIENLYKESFNLRFQKSSGQLENTSRVSKVRKLIARIKTIKNEKVKEN